MSKVRVAAFSISLDGFGAGPAQDSNNPLGVRGADLLTWLLNTEVFKKMTGGSGGSKGMDNRFAAQSFENVGAWIIGRNMFGPVRGLWNDEAWKGWWGANPPFHTPVFVLTHHARPALLMDGGTTFHFVTDGAEAALASAKQAAAGKDVRVGGGPATIRQYLAAGLVDEMHLAMSPILLGQGEALLAGLDMPKLGFSSARTASGESAFHILLQRT